MTFNSEKPNGGADHQEDRELSEHQKQGAYFKGLIALTNGVLSARKQRAPGKNFLVASIEQARETYGSLDRLEKEIDPSGNLSADVLDLTTNGLGKLADWLEAHGGAPKKKV
jgi:hypothetical protein